MSLNWTKPGTIIGGLMLLASLLLTLWLLDITLHDDVRKYLLAALWFTDLLFAVLGFLVIQRKVCLKVLAVQVVLFLLFLELGLGVFDGFVRSRTHHLVVLPKTESQLGWQTRPNQQLSLNSKYYGDVYYSTTRDGFRVYGNPKTDKLKILVIGDSFTQANIISDEETYYDTLQKQLPEAEIFAYGSTGYGSLQEYLVLDKHVDVIQPDVIVWQYCFNDFINNHLQLQTITHANSAQMVQPFYLDGKVQLLYPHRFGFLLEHSRLLRLLDSQWHILADAVWGTVEEDLKPGHPMYQPAVEKTSEIMALVKKRAGNIPVVAFSAAVTPEYDAAFAEISRENGIYYVNGVQATIDAAKAKGKTVDFTPYDNHWNTVGHGIAGQKVLSFLQSHHLVPAHSAQTMLGKADNL